MVHFYGFNWNAVYIFFERADLLSKTLELLLFHFSVVSLVGLPVRLDAVHLFLGFEAANQVRAKVISRKFVVHGLRF